MTSTRRVRANGGKSRSPRRTSSRRGAMPAARCTAIGRPSPKNRRHRCRCRDVATIDVRGLSRAQENLEKLDEEIRNAISREALRDAGWTLAKAMRAATYTTFNRRDGLIRSGLGVAVQGQPKGEQLKGYVTEYPQY